MLLMLMFENFCLLLFVIVGVDVIHDVGVVVAVIVLCSFTCCSRP